jgi:hypothetical protein
MKKYIYILFASLGLLTSCEEDLIIYDSENGQSVATLGGPASATLPVPPEGAEYVLPVQVTTVSDSDRSISILVDESSTADPSEYSIDPASLVIPAGEYVGNVRIVPNFDAIPDLTTTTIALNLDGVDGATIDNVRTSFALDIFKKCDSELAGTYDVLSTGESTDGGTGFPTVDDFPYVVEITKNPDSDIEYFISDGVAGVYIEWYTVYGYTFETEGNFTDVCQSLSGSWVDAFGSTVNLTGTDNGDGTLTINWVNGFGDTVTAIYTKR